jgi:uncharacterized GH25 family protein
MARLLVIAMLSAAALLDGPPAVTGRVVADASGEPIVNARVRIAAAGRSTTTVITDVSGRFSFVPPDGQYTVVAIKSGYIRQQQLVRSANEPLEIRLVRAAVVSGRVVDVTGEPVVNATVVVESPGDHGPGRSIARTLSDDTGRFRVSGIAAGPVVAAALTLSALPSAQTLPNGATVFVPRESRLYYPDGDLASAAVIALHPGEEHADLDFVVPADQIGSGTMMLGGFMAPRPTPPGSPVGTVRGRVTEASGGALAGAQVQLRDARAPAALRGTRSDAQGRFEFADVPTGTFHVTAGKAGYEAARASDAVLPMLPPTGAQRSVDVHEQAVTSVELELRRLGTVSGQVVDELGDPIDGASVQLLRVRFERGRRRLVTAGMARMTDDRGHYRIFDVAAGQYLVTASIGGVAAGDLPGYGRTFYPGTREPRSAQYVRVSASQDLAGIDLSLEPEKTARVAGTILGVDGQPSAPGTLQLRPNVAAGELTALPVGAIIKDDGTFEFPNVPPGQYLIFADRGCSRQNIEGDFATLPVAVDGVDVTGLTIQVARGSSIAGRVVFDTADRDHVPAFSTVQISPVPVDPDMAPGNVATAGVETDGTFQMQGVTGVRRLAAARVPTGWAVREIRAAGADVTDRPLSFGRPDQSIDEVEVVLTDRVAIVGGSVVNGDGGPAAGALVVAIPVDRDLRYPGSRFLRQTAVAADGTFAFSALPGGAYYMTAAAATLDGPDAWQDPALLEAMSATATSVTLRDGEQRTLALRVGK